MTKSLHELEQAVIRAATEIYELPARSCCTNDLREAVKALKEHTSAPPPAAARCINGRPETWPDIETLAGAELDKAVGPAHPRISTNVHAIFGPRAEIDEQYRDRLRAYSRHDTGAINGRALDIADNTWRMVGPGKINITSRERVLMLSLITAVFTEIERGAPGRAEARDPHARNEWTSANWRVGDAVDVCTNDGPHGAIWQRGVVSEVAWGYVYVTFPNRPGCSATLRGEEVVRRLRRYHGHDRYENPFDWSPPRHPAPTTQTPDAPK